MDILTIMKLREIIFLLGIKKYLEFYWFGGIALSTQIFITMK